MWWWARVEGCQLVAGEEINYRGEVVTLRGTRLGISPAPHTPVYLGSLGPEMLRLAGELSDGVNLNWCTPEQIAWSRERIAEGAARASRAPAEVRVAEYIRICVDDDEVVARRAFARSVMRYALGDRVPTERERALGYRAHFERMGFADPWPSWTACVGVARPRTRSPTHSHPSCCSKSATSDGRPERPGLTVRVFGLV